MNSKDSTNSLREKAISDSFVSFEKSNTDIKHTLIENRVYLAKNELSRDQYIDEKDYGQEVMMDDEEEDFRDNNAP